MVLEDGKLDTNCVDKGDREWIRKRRTEQRFIGKEPTCCPVCGSGEVDWGSLEPADVSAERCGNRCLGCNTTWDEIHRFDCIEIQFLGKAPIQEDTTAVNTITLSDKFHEIPLCKDEQEPAQEPAVDDGDDESEFNRLPVGTRRLLTLLMGKYENDPPDSCPLCGCGQVYSHAPRDDGHHITIKVYCNRCRSTWYKEYVYDGITYLMPGK